MIEVALRVYALVDKHILRNMSRHKGEHCALIAAVVDMAVVAGALVVNGEAEVAASQQCEHQWPNTGQSEIEAEGYAQGKESLWCAAWCPLDLPTRDHKWACLNLYLGRSFIHLTEW